MATTATAPIPHTPPAPPPAAAAEQPFCSDLCARVQAVWEAFCACLSDLVTWCLSFVSSSAPVKPAAAAGVTEHLKPTEQVSAQLDAFDLLAINHIRFDAKGIALFGPLPSSTMDIPMRLDIIKKVMNRCHSMHMVANPAVTSPNRGDSGNATQLLLDLEADPNARSWSYNYTPLHCAVLTGSLLAYRILREAGADPLVKNIDDFHVPGPEMEEDHPIGWAEKILTSDRKVHDHFMEAVLNSNRVVLTNLFPIAYGKHPDDKGDDLSQRLVKICGTRQDISDILAYEKELVQPHCARIAFAWSDLPAPLCQLIGDYLRGQVMQKPSN